MHRLALLIGSALIVIGCSVTTPTPTPSPSAGPSTSTSTPRPTPTPVPVAGCPTTSPQSVSQYASADPACFDGQDVSIRGWLDSPPAVGWEPPVVAGFPYQIPEPGALWHQGPVGNELCSGAGDACAWFFIYVARDSPLQVGVGPRWVIVTGHRMDPASEGCYWYYGDGEAPAETYALEDARADCRSRFVLTGITEAPPA